MISVLFFLLYMSQLRAFRVPAIVYKDTGAITINVLVDTGIAHCPCKLLIHTYSRLTWVTTGLTTYTRVEGEGTPSETVHKLPWNRVFTADNEPLGCRLNHAKRVESEEQPISFMTYGKDNYESKLDFRFFKEHKIILTNDDFIPSLELPLTLAIADQIMQIVPENQTRPLQQFSGVIGAEPSWNEGFSQRPELDPAKSLFCILSESGQDPILAFDIKMEGDSMIGFGQPLHKTKGLHWVMLPINHKRGSRAPFHKYWTFDADIMVQYPKHAPMESIRAIGSEMMIDTTTDIVSLPVSVFNKLLPIELKDKYDKYQLLYDFFVLYLPKICDTVTNLLPSIIFRFQMANSQRTQPLIVTIESSLLIKRDTQDKHKCRSLLRPQADVDFDFWKIGMPFLYKVYMEFRLLETHPVVKLFDNIKVIHID